jgi:tetratricopeptide (TPR) repeat protein
MPDLPKAVFLSYASQDAEVAKRICEALRAAGVEVWFDQSELVGGDAWDAKIKKQIRECALFVPIISPATNARAEGYFRREWKQAVERTHDMADDMPFLFPIVIGDITDATARVPDKFREVQWTRLKLEETPAELAARIARLLSGGAAAPEDRGQRTENRKTPGKSAGWQWWMIFPIVGTITGLMFAFLPLWRAMNRPAKPAPAVVAPPSAPGAPAVSAARELVAKAYPLIHALDARREDFALAEDYCQRALKLDPDDGEIWAAYAQVHAAFGYRGWDTSPERREQTRVSAERAIRLAPHSVRARLAQAGAWASFGVNRDEREKLLRDIVSEQPDHQEALRFLAVTVLPKPNGLEEALALNERSAALPGGDPLALFNNARYLWQRGRSAEGYATLQRALAQRKFTSALVLKMAMEINMQGDLVAAEETLRQIPGDALLEDRANYGAGQLRYYQRNGAAALATWQMFPRDFYSDFVYDGPKGLLLGLAAELDHRDAAARTEWRAALLEVEKRIAAAPNKAGLYFSQAYLLACLGEKAAAQEALRTYEQLGNIKYAAGQPMANSLAKVYARLGRFDEIFARPPETPAILKISPDFDGLRADPRFAAWVSPATPPTH